uniref:Uncharacterized protein n=1 Tax=Glossina pallidipes TaxID=7398 RepID=A0A1A9ZD52_GLOPL
MKPQQRPCPLYRLRNLRCNELHGTERSEKTFTAVKILNFWGYESDEFCKTNTIYNLSIHDLNEQQRLVWYSPEDDQKMCVVKGKDEIAVSFLKVTAWLSFHTFLEVNQTCPINIVTLPVGFPR